MKFEKLKTTKYLFLIFLGIAIFLRIINIISEQLWVDEAGSIYYAKAPFNKFWTIIINDIHPPLYYIILKGWIFLFGYSVFSCRLLSAIFSILTLPFLFLIGKDVKNEKLGLIIIFLYSISPLSIFYANEVRSYSLIHLLFTILLLFSIRCIKSPRIPKNYIFLGIFGTLLIYTHYIGILYLIGLYLGIIIFNLCDRTINKNVFFSIIIVIACYIPWIPFAINDAFGGSAGYTGGQLNLINLLYYAYVYFLAPVPSDINNPYILNMIFLTFIINIPLIIISTISIIGFLFSLKKKNEDLKHLYKYLISILGLIFGISIIMGFLIPNSFTAKNLIGGLSVIYIFEAIGLYYLFFDKNSNYNNFSLKLLKIFNPQILRKICYPIIIILLINSIIIYPLFRAVYLQKPDWEGCAKRLKKDFRKHDIVINSYGRQIPDSLRYYCELHDFDLSDNSYILNYEDDDIEEFFDELSEDDITRIWFIFYWLNLDDSVEKTEDKLIDEYNLTKVDEYEYRIDIILAMYEIP